MKKLYILLAGVLLLLLTGCPATTTGPTSPADAPQLFEPVSVTPSPVNVGQMVIFFINYVDVSGDVNGGQAIITDTQNNQSYQGQVSNATGTSGTLSVSITLSPLTRRGTWLFSITVYDRAGNPSNPVNATVVVI